MTKQSMGKGGFFSAVLMGLAVGAAADGATVEFFHASQVATPVAAGETWDAISCGGYQFTYTRDKLFTGGIGPDPIGRQVRIPWPDGVEAQAVTAGPNPSKAKITIARGDGAVFDLPAFTARLLANTAGAGGSIEIMPKLNGEDAWNDPAYFQASGYSWSTFSYDTSTPSYLGNTSRLTGFESYTVTLYVDFALTALTLEDASAGLPGDFDLDGDVDGADLLVWQRGETVDALSAAELGQWKAGFGAAAALAVPEPGCWAIALLAIAGVGRRAHRGPHPARFSAGLGEGLSAGPRDPT